MEKNKIEEGLDYVKNQKPSRQRYYFMFGGIVIGVVLAVVASLFI